MKSNNEASCPIPDNDPIFKAYHDTEWGVPATSDLQIFEKICLEGFQSGLSWRTILHKRDAIRQAFDYFDPAQIRAYGDSDVERLLTDPCIVRNRRKILSVINNANKLPALIAETGSLAAFVWSFEPQSNKRPTRISRDWLAHNPMTVESKAMADALKRRGWSFVGPVNMYALMQALGIVNDHVHGCPRRKFIDTLRRDLQRPKKLKS